MDQYEYKVVSVQAIVLEGDIARGIAGEKIGSQVEISLCDLAKQGYEYYREFAVPVKVATGCFSKKIGRELTFVVMVFRRLVR